MDTPAPSPTPAARAPGSLSPEAGRPSVAVILARTAGAEASLRSGSWRVLNYYQNRIASIVTVAFDLGDRRSPPRLHVTTDYPAAQRALRIEQITIGDRSWERQGNGAWTEIQATADVQAEVRALLPHAARARNAESVPGSTSYGLRWRDTFSGYDNLVEVDPATGRPLRLAQSSAANSSVRVVQYAGWNLPVTISPPT